MIGNTKRKPAGRPFRDPGRARKTYAVDAVPSTAERRGTGYGLQVTANNEPRRALIHSQVSRDGLDRMGDQPPPARRRSYQGLKRSARKWRHTPLTAAGQPSWISPKARTFSVTRVLSATCANS